MKFIVKPEQALTILKTLAAHRRKWGKHMRSPYSWDQVLDALVLVEDQGALTIPDGPSKEEITLLRRQLAACQNREKARRKREGITESDAALAARESAEEPVVMEYEI